MRQSNSKSGRRIVEHKTKGPGEERIFKVTLSAVAEAHDLGLRVIPWTVNRRAMMRQLIAWGADGLITDRPDVAMAVLSDEYCG